VNDPFDPWSAVLAEIDREIEQHGYWTGEAGQLRDAVGSRRLTRQGWERIRARLAEAGLECEQPMVLSEAEPLMVGRTGAADLAKEIEKLLPALREADRKILSTASFRDASVAREALRHWRGRATQEDE
jgi:hypothetical protein